ncbi:ATP-binding cassette domain-containing protein [Streptomyces sp. 3MP-14]|uniref:ATP-binding cassette domain-containing protein n=1 Tax=Streptomyces mimosae TaxID=2586635 RepID=A0A5N5ZY56_9ACTN|nr:MULTISPECIES: ABC transporter ATP-binding protein [Streptomyces]KAB8160300.1 ATP-binding cassette domain-containing protein [Streptomyces mimosae]KAB8172938.1 ATP-binding cassette domain-containing protein [Streptomyces sp. 3MP-14]
MNVVLDRVSVAVGGRTVVHEASLRVESGRFLGLVGPNGSGKSTLLRALYRVLRPHTGTVRLAGDDAWRLPPREVARRVAVLTQESGTDFDLDVLDVVLLGRLPHHGGFGGDSARDLALVRRALERVGASALADRPFAALSGGERQRVLLARALVQESQVLVLDEPTNHLDIAFQLELMRLVGGLGVTTVAALHDLNLAAAHCDEIAVLRDGRVTALGPPDDVLTPEVIHDVFGVRAHLLRHPVGGRPLIAFSDDTPVVTPHQEHTP